MFFKRLVSFALKFFAVSTNFKFEFVHAVVCEVYS